MNFFVDLTKSLLSPRALQGFIIGLFIGDLTVLVSSQFLYNIINNNLLPIIGNLIGATFVAWYGIWFASKTQGGKSSAIAVFFLAGLIGFFLIRIVIEKSFDLSPDQLVHNVVSYAITGGITCALAGGFFEAITKSNSE
jgi:hypothetical protein